MELFGTVERRVREKLILHSLLEIGLPAKNWRIGMSLRLFFNIKLIQRRNLYAP